MLARYYKGKLDPLLSSVVKLLPDHRLIPNILTLIGLLFSLLTGIFFALNLIRIGGVFIIIAGLFDILDGAYARLLGRTSSFGAFIDSTSDRYADMLILSGLGVMFARKSAVGYLILTLVTMIGFVMVSYTKARAESIISRCDVGIMERPERVILLALGALTLRVTIALWILAGLTHVTVLQRIRYTYQQTKVKGMGFKEEVG